MCVCVCVCLSGLWVIRSLSFPTFLEHTLLTKSLRTCINDDHGKGDIKLWKMGQFVHIAIAQHPLTTPTQPTYSLIHPLPSW